MIETALTLYDRGFKIFPLVPGGKEPAVKNWQKWAEDVTEEKIRATNGHGYNWGVFCGASGLTVVDLDVKREDKNGIKAFSKLQEDLKIEFPDTFMVRTPSGGVHLYYKGANRTSAGALAPGIDTRGFGGYVVAPGSQINGAIYKIEKEAPIIPLPAILGKLLEKDKPKVLDDKDLILEGERNDTLTSLAGTMRSRGMCEDAIYAALIAVNDKQLENPLPDEEIKTISQSVARYAPEHAQAASDFLEVPKITAIKASNIDASKIAPRNWYMKHRYIGGFISVIVSPGGIGKSILSMLDAVALSTGQSLTGFEVKAPAGVWIYNTEDPSEELRRRMLALSIQHKIPLDKLDKVFLTSGREIPLIIAKNGKDGLVINKNAMGEIVDFIRANDIKVMIADPFVRTHEVSENDNMQIDKVVWCFQRIADQTGCAIGIIHHTRKQGSNGFKADMDSARGASALVNAARVAHVLQTMDSAEAKRFGIPSGQESWYMRFDNAKANLQPPAESAMWFKKASITLPNGDDVGAISKIELVDRREEMAAQEALSEAADMARVWASKCEVGARVKIIDAKAMLGGASYLFSYSDFRGREKIIGILQSGECRFGDKIFEYEFDEEARNKHFMVCKKYYEMDFLD